MLEVKIYNKLVELFSIDEVCIKRYHNRPQLTWINFISGVLKLDSADLPKFCGLSSSSAFSRYFNKNFKSIMEAKQGGHWRIYLLSLIDYIHCSTCGNIKSSDNFTKSNRSINGLRSVCKSCTSEYYLGNKEHIIEVQKKYVEANIDKVKQYRAEFNKTYRVINASYFAYQAAKRRAAKLQATPNWADHETIKQIYETCPEGYHVDHIVPLQNDLVCGLHCEFNLQHLTAEENQSKGNKFTC